MGLAIKCVEYYYTTVDDKHGKAYWLLEHLRQQRVNLTAFTVFPLGGNRSQMDFVADNTENLQSAASAAGVQLTGPKRAFLVQGKDNVGAIVELHQRLSQSGIGVHAASGVNDGEGRFGYVFWVKPGTFDKAAAALGVSGKVHEPVP